MIKLFRGMRQRLLSQNPSAGNGQGSKISKYLLYALGEILLVVIGIMIALQINNANEARKQYETANILANSLVQDLQKDVEFLYNGIEFSKQKMASCDVLLGVLSKPIGDIDPSEFYENMNIVGQSNPFFPTDGTYQQIITSGTLKIFDQSLANKLNAYDMHTNKTLYWTDVEDKTLWLMAEILWTGINIQALGEIRFDLPIQQERYIKIREEEVDEFSNYIAATKTYRQKILMEYNQQLEMAEDLIETLKSDHHLD
jgi:hypothetical protein